MTDITSQSPGLSWREVVLELDHPEFNLSDMEGLRIVMQAYRAATVVSVGAGGQEGGQEGGGGVVWTACLRMYSTSSRCLMHSTVRCALRMPVCQPTQPICSLLSYVRMSVTCLSHVCHMSVRCLSHVCQMSVRCLSRVCHMSVTCLSDVCHVSVTYVA